MLVGNPEEFHVGGHFQRAAHSLGSFVSVCDVRAAYIGSRWMRAIYWRWDRRPLRLARFSQELLAMCYREKPTHLLTTGLAPVRSQELAKIGTEGVLRLTFLTDDPWNPVHRGRWIDASLREYDHVFSPRRANLKDLGNHGCRQVHYLPFAYSPDVHVSTAKDVNGTDVEDVLFAGGADLDRLPYIRALISAGLKVALYGSYWDRYADLQPHWRGHADLATLRRMTPAAKIVLCLVRRANRDGHAMRSFEASAMGGCMLAEDTPEHREIFGPDGEAVLYFRTVHEMIDQTRWLLERHTERKRLAATVYARITGGQNTYADRLKTMLQFTR